MTDLDAAGGEYLDWYAIILLNSTRNYFLINTFTITVLIARLYCRVIQFFIDDDEEGMMVEFFSLILTNRIRTVMLTWMNMFCFFVLRY